MKKLYYLLTLALISSAVIFSSCEKEESPIDDEETPSFEKTISEIASSIVKSLNSENPDIVVEFTDTGVMLYGSVKVVATDIVGTNGVIHVIDQVILPIENGSILDAAMGLDDFSSLLHQ